ncbi:MAG: translocation/assembly module TamB domain-containing protein, partial [Cyanobacteria bacterium J06628_3]
MVAKGDIPIYNDESIEIENPLSITLNQLAINLKGLYQGGVGGQVSIKGAALNPVISGNINLNDGLVSLPEGETENTTVSSSGIKRLKVGKDNNQDENTRGRFDNLKLTLGDKVKIESPPIISIQASGDLN